MTWKPPQSSRSIYGDHVLTSTALWEERTKWPSPQGLDQEVEDEPVYRAKVSCCNDKACEVRSGHRRICEILISLGGNHPGPASWACDLCSHTWAPHSEGPHLVYSLLWPS